MTFWIFLVVLLGVGHRHLAVDSPSGCLLASPCLPGSFHVSALFCGVLAAFGLVIGIVCGRRSLDFLVLGHGGGSRASGFSLHLSRGFCGRFWTRWAIWICLLAPLRFGEASHPGPEWTFGIANLNGLNSKAFGLADSTVDSWIFTETHLTKPGEKVFRANLKEAKAPYTSFVGGSPVPPRSEVSDIGQFSGVGILSKYPVRRLPHSWPDVVFRSGRMVAVSVCCQGIWVSGVIVYGTPNGSTHGNGRELTNQLLSLAVDRVNQLHGPRFVAGDFNHDLDKLPAVSVLQRLGFQDCQDAHASRTGVLPLPTCRGKTRRDFMLMSRELSDLFQSCEVDDNTVSDHAALVCRFSGGVDLLRYAWPIPDQMEWEPLDSRPVVSGSFFDTETNVSEDYSRFWAAVESSNQQSRRSARKPIVRAMVGRASVSCPQIRTAQVPPFKASRPGDRQPAFLGSCLQHVQWTKQLRRLQSYLRLAGSPHPTASHRVHRLQLWSSIRSARGFAPSFPSWWAARSLSVGEPVAVPEHPPDGAVASLFYCGMEFELNGLEKCLRSARSHAKRLMRASDAHAIYGAVKRDAPVQVDSLVSTTVGVVARVDEDECAVELERPVCFSSEAPLFHSSGMLQIIHHEGDKIWVDSCQDLEPGVELTQKKPVGRLEDLFVAFESQWSALWNQHEALAPSQWDGILDFAKTQLRPVPPSSPTFSVEALLRCARRKSRHSAISLDGISRADVLALHPAELATVLKIYGLACTTGAWPSQMLLGYVRSLAKTPDPEHVGHYRPITVFSFLYRIWSSISAKHWLRQLSRVVDPFLFGSTTGGRASKVWRHVLESVEAAHRGDGPACGFVADIVKAFNALPRLPALTGAKLLGVDQGTLLAWAGALSGFRRHFVIQGSYSPGVSSCNGFPEGCAMSCVAMVVLTDLFHKWVRATNVLFKPVSYVDNWAVLLNDPLQMRQACDAVDRFADMLQINLDAQKSFTWSTDREGRKSLRTQGFKVLNAVRDLGAHVVYTCQLANKTALDRFKELDDFWIKLKAATCTFRQKTILVTRVAWPRALHAVSAVVIGKKHFEGLRTSAMQALGIQKPGASPDLQCCLESLQFDPQVFACLETIRDARSLGSHCQIEMDLEVGPLGNGCPVFNSVSEILVQRLHQLGFSVCNGAVVQDTLGRFSILSCGFGELLVRVQLAWSLVVASRVVHRASFRGFENVDVVSTRSAYHAYSGFDQGVLRKFLHGANFTNEHAKHWSESKDDKCLMCGQLDSAWHRLWECSGSSALRQGLPEDILVRVAAAPLVVSLHGWTLRSQFCLSWLQYLDSLPREFLIPREAPPCQIVDLFTDGSCLFPDEPAYRVAAFSVIHAAPFCLDYQPSSFRPLVAQPLAGVLQSAYRAELQAIVAALAIACRFGVWVRIWSDSASAIAVYKKHVVDLVPVNLNSRHVDLLSEMVRLAQELGTHKVALMKVPAHVDKADFTSEFEHWLIDGNRAADRAAGCANQLRDARFWRLWEDHVNDIHANRELAAVVRAHMVAVGRVWADHQPTSFEPVNPLNLKEPRPARPMPTLRWSSEEPMTLHKPTFVRQFGSALAADVGQWISNIRDSEAPLRWISWIHLYLSFLRRHGPIAISKREGQWMVERGEVAGLSNHSRFSLRAKWFRLMVQQFLRDAQVDFVTVTTKPFSQWVCCFRGALAFQISSDEFDFVENILSQQLGEPATGSGKKLELLRG